MLARLSKIFGAAQAKAPRWVMGFTPNLCQGPHDRLALAVGARLTVDSMINYIPLVLTGSLA
jgi:hypothetical protein